MKGLKRKQDDPELITRDEARVINIQMASLSVENQRVSNLLDYFRNKCRDQAALIDTLRSEVAHLEQFKPVPPPPPATPTTTDMFEVLP